MAMSPDTKKAFWACMVLMLAVVAFTVFCAWAILTGDAPGDGCTK